MDRVLALLYLSRMSTDTLLIHCTCPDRSSADVIARKLVEQRLAACVSTLPAVTSTYIWEGSVETAEEVLLLVKSNRQNYPGLEQAIVSMHPYELPEIIAVPVDQGLPEYLQWIDRCAEQES